MMITDILCVILAFMAGIALGVFFFGGLWLTIKKAVTAKTPAIWFFISFFLRISVVFIGFYCISLEGLQQLMACLIGFMIARWVVTHFTKSIHKKQTNREVYYEA